MKWHSLDLCLHVVKRVFLGFAEIVCVCYCFVFETYCKVQIYLKLMILLPQCLDCWYYRYIPSCLVSNVFLFLVYFKLLH